MDSYRLIESKIINESHVYFYKHFTGNNIVFFKNNFKNLCFSIAYRTKPENNTGVAHLLEHIILRGSLNYNVKDPFNDISKGSLYSYLNAITYPDKTIFPFATYNEKEFLKILNIYLDAVYNPLLEKKPFLEEKQIVFNEMSGVYSDIYEVLGAVTKQTIFNDTYIGNFFAGNPDDILDLSHKDVLDYYNSYYLNKEAYIYVYGDIDINKYLTFFEKFFSKKVNYIDMSTNFNNIEKYFITNYDGDEKYFTINYILDDYTDFENIIVAEILIKYLNFVFSTTIIYLDKEIKHPTITIFTQNEKFNEHIKKHIYNDLDKNILIRAINQVKFSHLESYGYKPKGLVNNFLILNNYLNKKNIFEPLNYANIIDHLQPDNLYNRFIKIINTEVIVELLPNKKVIFEDKYMIKSLDFDTIKPEKQLKVINLKDLYFFNLENKDCYYLKIMFKIDSVDYYSLGLMQKLNFSSDNIYISHEAINGLEYFIFNLKGLVSDFEQHLELVQNIINNMLVRSNLDPVFAKEIIKKQFSSQKLDFALNKVLSKFYCCNINIDKSSYFDFYCTLCKKNQIYEPQNIFSKSNLDIYLGINEIHLDVKKKLLDKFKNNLFEICKNNDVVIRHTNDILNDILKLKSSNINMLAIKTGLPISGGLLLLSHIIENDYLVNKVRIELGAYGYGTKITPNGDFIMFSFKDPNKYKTIDVFKNAYNYINDLKLSKEQLNDYKIGCFNNIFKPTHEYNSYKKALDDYFYKIDYDTIFKQIKSVSNISDLCNIIKLDENNSCFLVI